MGDAVYVGESLQERTDVRNHHLRVRNYHYGAVQGRFQELLERNQTAVEKLDRSSVAAIKKELRFLHEKDEGLKTKKLMAPIEAEIFFPAIQESYVEAPNVGVPGTWVEGLNNIELNLRYFASACEHPTSLQRPERQTCGTVHI